MKLFVESGQNYTFLLELILSYLKLEERKSVKLIRLTSPLTQAALTAIKRGKLKDHTQPSKLDEFFLQEVYREAQREDKLSTLICQSSTTGARYSPSWRCLS
jgi:hypothetical protein